MTAGLALLVLLSQGQAPTAAPVPAASSYVPQRVYDTRRAAFTDFETMLADLARPVENLDTAAPGDDDRKRADDLVYTIK